MDTPSSNLNENSSSTLSDLEVLKKWKAMFAKWGTDLDKPIAPVDGSDGSDCSDFTDPVGPSNPTGPLEPLVADRERILLVGCGGGYDIYGGYFLYRVLTEKFNKYVFLANYSFTDDLYRYQTKTDPTHEQTREQVIIPVTGLETLTSKNKDYFPEYHLAQHLQQTVFAIRELGVEAIAEGLKKLCQTFEIDLIILVDNGHDALLLGDEGKRMASPVEDMTTVLATLTLQIPSLLCCVSVPTECLPEHLWLRHKQIMQDHKGLVAEWDPKTMDEKQKASMIADFEKLLDRLNPVHRSIPNECILASMKGVHEKFFVNPRLEARMISDGCTFEDYPSVWNWTTMHYFFDLRVLEQQSRLILFLQKHHEEAPQLHQFSQLIHEYYNQQNNQ